MLVFDTRVHNVHIGFLNTKNLNEVNVTSLMDHEWKIITTSSRLCWYGETTRSPIPYFREVSFTLS